MEALFRYFGLDVVEEDGVSIVSRIQAERK